MNSITLAFISFLSSAAFAGALPSGATPEPVPLDHFPNRLCALVWRPWNLVPAKRLAAVVGTETKDIRALADALGCGPETGPFHGGRIAQTIIRRTWHLLDYPQLLALLGWNEGELADCLIEHDFFWIKLGRLKPNCAPLVYQELTPQEKGRAARFKAIVEAERARVAGVPREERFAFLKDFATGPGDAPKAAAPPGPLSIRYIYSYFAVFGDPLLQAELDPYPDGLLARLAARGVNGVWLHVVLGKLAPGAFFPEETERAARRLANLGALVDRAKRHGIGIYLYFNEPRAQPPAFFATREDLRGVAGPDLAALCTSTAPVKEFLRQGARQVFAAVPGLAGFFTITASENLTSCYSHGGGAACPRCKDRSAAEVIAEVTTLLAEGAWEANPRAEAIAWDWGWDGAWIEGIIGRLPKRCRVMSVSEWSVPIERGGIASAVGEYALSAMGPGPRARRTWEIAARNGLRTMAKVQVNNTWELSSVPFIPIPATAGEHVRRLREQGLSGLMLSWSLGGYPSINLSIVDRFCGEKIPSLEDALRSVAEERYGAAAAPEVVEAWRRLSDAFNEFPYEGRVLYCGPQQLGPANLLYPAKTGYAATMTGFPYDDLESWRAIYPAPVFIGQFRKLAGKWRAGMELFAAAIPKVPEKLRREAERDRGVAEAVEIHCASVADQAEFVLARDELAALAREEAAARARGEAGGKEAASAARRAEALERLRAACAAEIELARRLHALSLADARLGFEAANEYFYLPQDLLEKIANCRFILDERRF